MHKKLKVWFVHTTLQLSIPTCILNKTIQKFPPVDKENIKIDTNDWFGLCTNKSIKINAELRSSYLDFNFNTKVNARLFSIIFKLKVDIIFCISFRKSKYHSKPKNDQISI